MVLQRYVRSKLCSSVSSNFYSHSNCTRRLIPKCLRDPKDLQALSRLGFHAGDVLNIHLPNTPEYGIAFNAAAALGGVVTTSNPMYTAEELHHQLKDSKAKIILTAAPFKELAEKAAQGTSVERIVLAGTADDFSFAPGVQFAGTPASVAADTKKATVVMPYSSGTTGPPKGTMLSHSNLTSNVAQISTHPEFNLGMKQGDRVIGES